MNTEAIICRNDGFGIMKSNKLIKSSWSPGQEISLPSNSISPLSKEPPTNTSRDSGVAGLRDTPVHTPASQITCNSNNNQNANDYRSKYNNDAKNEDYDIPKFIVDQTTRTTFIKGRFLGKGGFARVHKVTDLTTNEAYAGKIIPKSRITAPHHKKKISREVDLHKSLRHKHVVRFHRYFEDDSNVYIILEYCSRRSLVHVLHQREYLTEPEVRYYMRQLVEGVAYVHSQRVIHRDLKLGNMFLMEDMTMKIGDFGLAARQSSIGNSVTICGTPNYIAPEVLTKTGHTYDADIWAIGCIMFAMLKGQPPFETNTLDETYSRIIYNKYTMPQCISSDAQSLIRDLLHSEPSARPSLREVLNHNFFTKGYVPRSLPSSASSVAPKFIAETISKSSKFDETGVSDIKKISSSVSTLRINNQKMIDSDKLNILDHGFQNNLNKRAHNHACLVSNTNLCNQKKDQAISSCLKQKLSSVICSSEKNHYNAIQSKKRSLTSSVLYNILVSALENMPDVVKTEPPLVSNSPVFISKWIDYSNKYGFGYQLSDLSVSVFFNDLTKLSTTRDKSRLEFHDCGGRVTCHQSQAVPAWLQERFQLLEYFSTYMEENLTDGAAEIPSASCHQGVNLIPHIRRWDRTKQSIIMQLSNGTFQINFLKDHTKIVLSGDSHDVTVMFVNGERQSYSYKLSMLTVCGCNDVIRERLIYTLGCLRQYAELDGEEV